MRSHASPGQSQALRPGSRKGKFWAFSSRPRRASCHWSLWVKISSDLFSVWLENTAISFRTCQHKTHFLWSQPQYLVLLGIPAKVLTQLKAAKLTISVNFPMRINFLQWKCCPFVIEKTIWNKMQKICLCFKSQSNLQVESSVKSPWSPDFYNLHILCSLASSKMEIKMCSIVHLKIRLSLKSTWRRQECLQSLWRAPFQSPAPEASRAPSTFR